MEKPAEPKPRRIAWGLIALQCGIAVYLVGVVAGMVAIRARGWLP